MKGRKNFHPHGTGRPADGGNRPHSLLVLQKFQSKEKDLIVDREKQTRAYKAKKAARGEKAKAAAFNKHLEATERALAAELRRLPSIAVEEADDVEAVVRLRDLFRAGEFQPTLLVYGERDAVASLAQSYLLTVRRQ